MTLPAGGLPDGSADAILAWCAGDRERLEIAYTIHVLKAADPIEDVERALSRELMLVGYFGAQSERAS